MKHSITDTAVADMQEAALFDFDGTLSRGDSIVPYLGWCVRHGLAPASQWLRAARGWVRQLRDPQLVCAAKAETLSFIRGRSRLEMDSAAEAFLRGFVQPRLIPEGVALLRQCAADGLVCVVLSASPEVYMRMLPAILPVDVVLATPCEVDAWGLYTGRVGENCRGEEKVRRYRAWMAQYAPELRCAIACGDSARDAPMLRLARRQVLIHPDRRLRGLFPDAQVLTGK